MILFKKAADLSQYTQLQQSKQKKVGFVPTMGALHAGHLSLIEASKKANDITVCSIFVNPTQFNNAEDFKHYPITIEADIEKLIANQCDVLFLPAVEEIYPAGFDPKHYDLGHLETVLEGYYRPGHFQGVCQVMEQLLTIVQPDSLYLGAKDYQQCMVITRLAALMNLQDKMDISIEPTLREQSGLAMSSRNLRLNESEKDQALAIFRSLQLVKDQIEKEEIQALEKSAAATLTENGLKVDYVRIVDSDTLLDVSENTKRKVVLVAAWLGNVRLIDNLTLN